MVVIYKEFLNFWPFYISFPINYFLIKRKECTTETKSKLNVDFGNLFSDEFLIIMLIHRHVRNITRLSGSGAMTRDFFSADIVSRDPWEKYKI